MRQPHLQELSPLQDSLYQHRKNWPLRTTDDGHHRITLAHLEQYLK